MPPKPRTTNAAAKARAQEKEAEEAAAKRTLQLEKEKAEQKEREEEKKRRASERRAEEEAAKQKAEEDKAKKAQAKAAESKRIFEEAKAQAKYEMEKKLAAQKAAEEEAAKTAAEEAAKKDAADPEINNLLAGINDQGGDDDEPMPEKEQDDDDDSNSEGSSDVEVVDVHSPPKKKKKSSKKEKKEKKKKKKDKKDKKDKGTDGTGDTVMAEAEGSGTKLASSLKERRYAGAGSLKPSASRKSHKHKFNRTIVESSIILKAPGDAPEKMIEFTNAIKSMVSNFLLIDEYFQIEPRDPLCLRGPYYHADDVPRNQSVMSFHIRTSGGGDAFAMQKPRKNQKKGQRRNVNRDEDEEDDGLVDPQVHFSFAFSSDVRPMELIDRVSCEWGKLGGQKFYLKAFTTFDTELAVVAINVFTRVNYDTLTAEFVQMLEEGQQVVEDAQDFGWDLALKEMPRVGVRCNMPKIPGQDTTIFSNWSTRQNAKRKMIHFEVESRHVKWLHEVVDAIKQSGILEKYWGKNAMLSNVIRDEETGYVKLTPKEVKNMCKLAKDHVNYQASMLSDVLEGVEDLDKRVAFASVSDGNQTAGRLSLRQVLYKYVHLKDGVHSLFVEIHQASPASVVEVVIPNTPEATELLEQINKNLGAFLYSILKELGADENFITNLIRASVDPVLCQEIKKCTWDAEKRTMTTPRDDKAAAQKQLEQAAWYKDEFGEHMEDKGKKQAKPDFVDEEMMYDHAADKSVHTVHEKQGAKKYQGTPGAPQLQLGRPTVIERRLDDDELSALSEWGKEDLINHIREMHVGGNPQGSQPKPTGSKSVGKTASKRATEESSSSSSSSSGDSSSSGSNKSAEVATPSAGGSADASQSAMGE